MSVEQKNWIHDLLAELSREVKATTSVMKETNALLTRMTMPREMGDSTATTDSMAATSTPASGFGFGTPTSSSMASSAAVDEMTAKPRALLEDVVAVPRVQINHITTLEIITRDAGCEQQDLGALQGQYTVLRDASPTGRLRDFPNMISDLSMAKGDAEKENSMLSLSLGLTDEATLVAPISGGAAAAVLTTVEKASTECSTKCPSRDVGAEARTVVSGHPKDAVLGLTCVAVRSLAIYVVPSDINSSTTTMCLMGHLGVYSTEGDTADVLMLLGDKFKDVPAVIEVLEISRLKLLVDLNLDNLLPANYSTVYLSYITAASADVLDCQPWPPPITLECWLDRDMCRPKPWLNFIICAVVLLCGFMNSVWLSKEASSKCLNIKSMLGGVKANELGIFASISQANSFGSLVWLLFPLLVTSKENEEKWWIVFSVSADNILPKHYWPPSFVEIQAGGGVAGKKTRYTLLLKKMSILHSLMRVQNGLLLEFFRSDPLTGMIMNDFIIGIVLVFEDILCSGLMHRSCSSQRVPNSTLTQNQRLKQSLSQV